MTTSAKITTTFLQLLKQDDYSKISINHTGRVGITRTCFYQLFDNKDSLAQAALFEIVQQILNAFTTSFDEANKSRLNYRSVVKGISLIRERQGELQALLSVNQASINLNADFQRQLAVTVVTALTHHFPRTTQMDYAVHVFIAATMETINWTISHPDVPVAQIVKMVDDFTGNGMLAVLRD